MVSTLVSHQASYYEDHYKGEMFSTMVSHQVLHHEDPYRGEEGIPQDWYKDPKQECGVASPAPSSKEGMFANVVPMSGDYTHTSPDEEAATNPCVTEEAAAINHGVTAEKVGPYYRATHIQEGGKNKNVSVLTEVENVSAPTKVEFDVSMNVSVPTEADLDVTTDPEVENQIFSLAPSSKEGINANVASTQFGD